MQQSPSPIHMKRRKIMFFLCSQNQGLLHILFHFILTITLSDRHDHLQILVEKVKSQKGYLLNAVQLGREVLDLNTDFFIQEIFIYLYYVLWTLGYIIGIQKLKDAIVKPQGT